MDRPHGFIYLIRNTVNGHAYIGQTRKTVERRWKAHLSDAQRIDKLIPLYCAIRKHGPDVFTVRTLTTARDQTSLDLKERILIRAYCAMNSKIGYNCRAGGEAGGSLSDETRARISAAKRGKKQSPEANEKRSLTQRGRKQSPEWVEKRASRRRGKPVSPAELKRLQLINVGRKATPEHVEKNRQASLGRRHSPESIELMREGMRLSHARRGHAAGPTGEKVQGNGTQT